MTDVEREECISAALSAMVGAETPEKRRIFLAAMTRLINERSPEQVERMEVERGLA